MKAGLKALLLLVLLVVAGCAKKSRAPDPERFPRVEKFPARIQTPSFSYLIDMHRKYSPETADRYQAVADEFRSYFQEKGNYPVFIAYYTPDPKPDFVGPEMVEKPKMTIMLSGDRSAPWAVAQPGYKYYYYDHDMRDGLIEQSQVNVLQNTCVEALRQLEAKRAELDVAVEKYRASYH
jgi:hypothetical protein